MHLGCLVTSLASAHETGAASPSTPDGTTQTLRSSPGEAGPKLPPGEAGPKLPPARTIAVGGDRDRLRTQGLGE